MTSNNKYASSSIYKVVDNAYTMCYYGSTTQQLSMRMTKHRMHYKLFAEGKSKGRFSVFDIFDAHGVENCKIELVEECPCESIEQLNKREGFYIQNNECVNKRVAGQTVPEWRSANRDHVRQMQADWRSANQEHVKQIIADWRSANQEHVKQTNADWKSANRERLQEKVTCDVCGGVCSRQCLGRHKRSEMHMAAMANNARQPEEEKAPAIV
jgi:hypothetical protein